MMKMGWYSFRNHMRDLFLNTTTGGVDNFKERKISANNPKRTRSKWLKAFKSLKSNGLEANTSKEGDKKFTVRNSFSPRFATVVTMVMAIRKNGKEKLLEPTPALLDSNFHMFQEYTYRKITACDVCQQILRGHTKQGLKCRLCKQNVHAGCKGKAQTCHPKTKLLRRQKSTSDIDSRLVNENDDQQDSAEGTHQVFRQAREWNESRKGVLPRGSPPRSFGSSCKERRPEVVVNSSKGESQYQHLSALQGFPRTSNSSSLVVDYVPNLSSSAPCSPVQSRHHAFSKSLRMNSVELPDDVDKSLSSEASPCTSPSNKSRVHRLLPASIYAVLYDFKAENPDELDLKAGCKVTVTDTTSPDWWKGKCLGKTGYFPSRYVTKLGPNEKVCQVTHNLQVTDGDSSVKLHRDEIVIQTSEEVGGMTMVRDEHHHQRICPAKYLVEI